MDSRDVVLWLGESDEEDFDADKAASLCRLPWNVVLSESSDKQLLANLEADEGLSDPLVRRRGLVHLVDSDPADSLLPPRHLAVFLLNGRSGQRRTGLGALTRRLTMLQDLRRRSIKQLLIVVPGTFSVPQDLSELWSDGFRTTITFVTADPRADELIQLWRNEFSAHLVDHVRLSLSEFSEQFQAEYLRGRDGALVLRVRDELGRFRTTDATALDDPERPLLGSYELIGNEVLSPLLPSDLTANEVDEFFVDTSASWRPYAAGMVWEREASAWDKLRSCLRALDKRGSEENRILYITAESGAGATAFIRDLAWRTAAEGYPTLVARRDAAPLSAYEIVSYLTRLINAERREAESARLYEVPCLLVFDQSHWNGRDAELISFAREIERSGRRVCILVAIGSYVSIGMLAERTFMPLANLSHRVPSGQAILLGRHLNRFLAPHGTDRSENEWRAFYSSSSVGDGQGIAAFWIVLSFWLQRQIDLGETVQSRVYRQFKEVVGEDNLKVALLRIAAFSTVRRPLPDALLPEGSHWPVTDKLDDLRKDLGTLGLIRGHGELDRYWAMAHDLLGRYLLTALFYDADARHALGLGAAANPEHLRFLVLKQISALATLNQTSLREVADAFAVSIFKIDPDHGHGSLAPFWREVLKALDEMPRSVRTTSRTFMHHAAISRRRIASDRFMFAMSDEDRISLLRQAVEELHAALRLDAPRGAETDLNLYNSLAHALHDLAEAEEAGGIDPSIVAKTRTEAQAVTRRAYSLNPDNTFVVETYARTLLSEGRADKALAVAKALEVLTLAYGLMDRPSAEARRNALSRLAERAFELLLEMGGATHADPDTESGAIAIALASLGRGINRFEGAQLSDISPENRKTAAELLAAAPIAGNIQAVKLRYMLAVLDQPLNFDLQLELLQSLHGSGPAFTPQMELELAVLLFQNGRPHEGDRIYRRLRSLWRRGEHFVEVPARLHWLLDATRVERRQVRGKVAANSDGRSFARVAEFEKIEIPFRAVEFSTELPRPGTAITGFVTFNHNGPFLRPLTARR
jgi:hypothetical protein